MKVLFGLLLLCVIFVSLAAADNIYLKNGLKIVGQVVSIGIDSVAVKTMSGEIKLPLIDIEKIETSALEQPLVPVAAEKTGNVSSSLRQVGFGCLGSTIGASLATIIVVLGGGLGDGKIATVLYCGLIIAGILVGIKAGGN